MHKIFTMRRFGFLWISLLFFSSPLISGAPYSESYLRQKAEGGAIERFMALQQGLYFEQNQGQFPDPVRFQASDVQASYQFLRDEIRAQVLSQKGGRPHVYGMKFIGMSPSAQLEGDGRTIDKSRGKINYLLQEGSIADAAVYQGLYYKRLWDGVDAHFFDSKDGMKYDFIVHPGGDPSQVRFEMRGVEKLKINAAGELTFKTPLGELKKGKPYTYQIIEGNEIAIDSRYVLEDGVVSFQIGKYDPAYALIIDPVALKFATVLGDTRAGKLQAQSAFLDPVSKNLYLSGRANPIGLLEYDTRFPPIGTSLQDHGFVLCLKGDGSQILWSTLLPYQFQPGFEVAVDAQGEVYGIVEFSNPSRGLPTAQVSGVQMVPGSLSTQRALFRLSSNGSQLKYVTYVSPYKRGQPGDSQPHSFGKIIPLGNGRVNIALYFRDTGFRDDVVAFHPTPGAVNYFYDEDPEAANYFNVGVVTLIAEIDTDIAGTAGLISASHIAGLGITDSERDAQGNFYYVGRYGYTAGFAKYTSTLFTHHMIDVDRARATYQFPGVIFKLSPDYRQVLLGMLTSINLTGNPAYINPSANYLTPSVGVDKNENIYFLVGHRINYNNASKEQLAASLETYGPSTTVYPIGPQVFPFGISDQFRFHILTKFPAQDYAKPEWNLILNAEADRYAGSGVEVDDAGRIHAAYTANTRLFPVPPPCHGGRFAFVPLQQFRYVQRRRLFPIHDLEPIGELVVRYAHYALHRGQYRERLRY